MRKGEVVLLLGRNSSLRMPERTTLNIYKGLRKKCVMQGVVNAREELRGKDKQAAGLNEVKIPQHFMGTCRGRI